MAYSALWWATLLVSAITGNVNGWKRRQRYMYVITKTLFSEFDTYVRIEFQTFRMSGNLNIFAIFAIFAISGIFAISALDISAWFCNLMPILSWPKKVPSHLRSQNTTATLLAMMTFQSWLIQWSRRRQRKRRRADAFQISNPRNPISPTY